VISTDAPVDCLKYIGEAKMRNKAGQSSAGGKEGAEACDVKIEKQNPRSVATELELRMASVAHAIDSLEAAQHITQDRLQLEVSV
jgi:hypothetical protein